MSTLSRLALALALGLASATAPAQPVRGGATPAPALPVTQLIVKLREPAPGQSIITTAARVDTLSAVAGVRLQALRSMSGGATVVQLPRAVSPATAEAMARRLAQSPDVELVSPDYHRLPSRLPDDPSYALQWHLMAPTDSSGGETTVGGANLPAAWDILTGSTATVLAVVDTGVLGHPDLAGRLLPGYDFISDPAVANDGNGRDSNPSDPGDWVSTADVLSNPFCSAHSPEPSSWHGTHVAGIAAATGNNASDVAGVNWQTRLLPIRVLGKCGGFDSDIIDAIRWAAGLPVAGMAPNPYPADVINLSLGGPSPCSAAMQAAMDEIYAAGVTVVAASGNDYGYSVSSPANCNHVIAVTAHAIDGTAASYANVGPEVALSAPGGGPGTAPDGSPQGSGIEVLATDNAGTTAPAAHTLGYKAGTSMATPVVAGTVALLRGLLPGLSPANVRTLLTSHVRPFPAGSWCTRAGEPQYGNCGAGLLDVHQTLQAASVLAGNHAPLLGLLTIRKANATQTLQFTLPTTDPDGDPLTHVAIDLPPGASLAADGTFRWPQAKPGKYMLTYAVSDGVSVAGPATVMISVGDPAGAEDGAGGAFPPLLLLALAALRRRR